MFAARQRATCAARQLQRTARTYASDSHAHAKPAEAKETFGRGSALALAAVVGGVVVYQITPADKEQSAITSLITKYTPRPDDWEDINSRHTKAAEQAAYDRNLFQHGGNGQRHFDITYPEAFQSHAPRNIKAGSLINLDHVVAHYRQEHLKDEEIKAQRLAARKE